ncbi:hypothetical protein T265_10303 [Opisthorchis viverrini]|uniref:Uncharacterized protein n=1 Tax=Opisthorchis viverrini TaxID=6198 RepID=A0A075A1R5_OPIVI|nr:hypothetical protein T265_10303 [Opisthorchis viverrini]KER21349.1 hypothetical protein T265_10303 [Opisthorchis viverrini]
MQAWKSVWAKVAPSYSPRSPVRTRAVGDNICNRLLIRLLKIHRQPPTGFALPLRAHQATECAAPGRLMVQSVRYLKYRDTCIFVMYYS